MAATTVHDRYTDEEIAAYYAAGFWESTTLTDLVARQAVGRGDAVFVLDGSTQHTFSSLRDEVVRLAAGLRRSGIERGDRVAVQLPNWTEFVVLATALSRIGAVIVPIMPIYRDDEVAYVLRHSGARAAVTCGEFRGFDHRGMFERLRAACPALESIHVARSDGADGLAALVVAGDLAELEAGLGPDSSPDDPFLIVYTSGTTSRPKGCFHTFNTLRASAAAISRSLAYTEADVQFGPSPITHSTGLVTSVVLPLLSGARSVLMEAWDPEAGLRLVQEHGCTVAVTATPFLQMLMGAYDASRHDASSLRAWVCAGSPIPGSVVTASRELFAGCQTLSLYGRSENFLTTMCTVQDPAERSATSDGSALAGAAVAIVDQTGAELPHGEEGDIAYKGPSHMIGYYEDEAQTAALFTPGGFSRSGDLGRMDADGFVRVTGRLKDIIIRGGMNISAREVEDHLLSHPSIAAVAAVAMPDERLGEKVCAYVVPASDSQVALSDLTTYLREHGVATQKLPERLEVVPELPMTATGKVQKHLLRADVATKLASGDARTVADERGVTA